jgi:hypothetical protein
MAWTHCQIFVDSGNAATPFTFPAGTIVAKVKCVGRGADGSGQNGGGGGGYGEAMIESPNLGAGYYEIQFADERCAFRITGSDPIASGANAVGVEGGWESNIGSTVNIGGNGGAWVGRGGGCGGGGAGGPDMSGVPGEQNDDSTGGNGGDANGGAEPVDLTDGIGPTRVYLVTNDGGRGGNGGNSGQDGQPGIFPGGGGGGHGDSPPNGAGQGGPGVVVILMEVTEPEPPTPTLSLRGALRPRLVLRSRARR